MFRPSQSNLFRLVPALQKFDIHPPLPLNPRESQQLLNLITTSFRHHLDEEHGKIPKAWGDRSHSGKEHARPRRRSFSDAEGRPTDRLMHSILTNPLFAYTKDKGTMTGSARDPMEIFDEAVAKGLMNIQWAHTCLVAKKREITGSPALSIHEAMRESGAGLKVVKWLMASGTANDITFMEKNESFTELLMEYMVVEKLQDVAWVWVKKALARASQLPELTSENRHDAERVKLRREICTPLLMLVKAEARTALSLDNAYKCIASASQHLAGMTTTQMRAALSPAGLFLTHQTLLEPSRHQAAFPETFDSFLSLIPAFASDVPYYSARLHLRHPVNPRADLALRILKSKQKSSFQDENTKIIRLGVDTARFLLGHDQYDDARWVMNYLSTKFPKELGIEETKIIERARAEASNLELLEGLSLA
ncbi:hypothetical protein F5884DRAFT_359737 [Xylogone sp. PMI_703]|nr:hypothetical protein F5884DRAFT_359737 [Xylogone sp. PMI_703]